MFVELAVDLLYEESIVRDWYQAKTEKPDMNLGEKVQAAAPSRNRSARRC